MKHYKQWRSEVPHLLLSFLSINRLSSGGEIFGIFGGELPYVASHNCLRKVLISCVSLLRSPPP